MVDINDLHKTLQRQLRRLDIKDNVPDREDFDQLLKMVSLYMHQADETRYTLERSMEISSNEMRELYDNLQTTSEKLLKTEKLKLASVIASVPQGVCAISKEKDILFLNEAAEQLLKFRPRSGLELLKMIRVYNSKAERLNAAKLTKQVFSGDHLNDFSAVLNRPDGTQIDISVSLTPLSENKKEATGVVLTMQDLTEHKQNLKELALALQNANLAANTKSIFLATMSHEIRTPLNGVIGMLELLLNTDLNQHQHEYAQVAKNSSDTLLAIINDILDFSKLEAGQVELESIEFNPSQLAEEIAQTITPKAEENNTTISTYCEENVPKSCKADVSRIKQILNNLVGNAVKFTKNGQVQIIISLDKVYNDKINQRNIRYTIKDTGIGIASEKLDKIFQPFQQADIDTAKEFGGTGLGLAISRELISLIGGEITVESQLGYGSSFTFNIPIMIEDYANQIYDNFDKSKILIIDKNQTESNILADYLQRMQIETYKASNFIEAVNLVNPELDNREIFDIIIIDINSTESVELINYINNERRLAKTKIIALSQLTEKQSSIEQIRSLVDHLIIKPIKQTNLLDCIQTCLSSRKTIQETQELDITKLNILLIEDNPVNQIIIKSLVSKLGHTFKIANSEAEALTYLHREDNFDIVLIDFTLPNLDGYQITKMIRSSKIPANQTYIIALASEHEDKSLLSETNQVLTHPIRLEKLQNALDAFVNDLAKVKN